MLVRDCGQELCGRRCIMVESDLHLKKNYKQQTFPILTH